MKKPSVLLSFIASDGIAQNSTALEWLVPVEVYIDLPQRLGCVTAGSGNVFKLYTKGN